MLKASVLFGHLYLMPILVKYLQKAPEVDAQCLFVDPVVNLVEKGLDVAVRIGELPDLSLQAVRVGQVRRSPVAAPDYLESRGRPLRPDDLARHCILSAGGVTPNTDWHFVDTNTRRR